MFTHTYTHNITKYGDIYNLIEFIYIYIYIYIHAAACGYAHVRKQKKKSNKKGCKHHGT